MQDATGHHQKMRVKAKETLSEECQTIYTHTQEKVCPDHQKIQADAMLCVKKSDLIPRVRLASLVNTLRHHLPSLVGRDHNSARRRHLQTSCDPAAEEARHAFLAEDVH